MRHAAVTKSSFLPDSDWQQLQNKHEGTLDQELSNAAA